MIGERLLERLTGRSGQPLRFLIVGGINTVVGLAAYPLLLSFVPWFRVHYFLGLLLVQVLCLIFAFLTHKYGTFRARGNVLHEFWKFSTFYLANYAANWLALPALVEWGGIDPILAQTGFAIIVVIGSYFWHSRVSFKTTEPAVSKTTASVRPKA